MGMLRRATQQQRTCSVPVRMRRSMPKQRPLAVVARAFVLLPVPGPGASPAHAAAQGSAARLVHRSTAAQHAAVPQHSHSAHAVELVRRAPACSLSSLQPRQRCSFEQRPPHQLCGSRHRAGHGSHGALVMACTGTHPKQHPASVLRTALMRLRQRQLRVPSGAARAGANEQQAQAEAQDLHSLAQSSPSQTWWPHLPVHSPGRLPCSPRWAVLHDPAVQAWAPLAEAAPAAPDSAPRPARREGACPLWPA